MGDPVDRRCDNCGRTYAAKTVRSKYCSDLCRTQASRAAAGRPRPPSAGPVVALPAGRPGVPGPVVGAITAELKRLDMLESFPGAMALRLADRMDNGRDTASALSALSRELRAAMQEVRTAGRPAGGIVDRVREQREKRERAAFGA